MSHFPYPLIYGQETGFPASGLVAAWDLGASAKNLLRYSEQFDTAVWTKVRASCSGAAVNSVTNPVDGTQTADTLIEDNTASNSHYASQASNEYVFSVYAKSAGRAWLVLQFNDGSVNRTWFSLTTGQVGTSSPGNTASVVSLGNGWYRLSVSRILTQASCEAVFHVAAVDASTAYSGDGVSGVYLYGAQVELGSTATAYTPTTDKQSIPGSFGTSYTLQVGSTAGVDSNDPTPVGYTQGYSFVTDDRVANIPAKSAAWTVMNCSDTAYNAVDSASGSYIAGVPQAGASEFAIGTTGGYNGRCSFYALYNRVLSSAEHLRAYNWLKYQRGFAI
jgi:hypothetical protein